MFRKEVSARSVAIVVVVVLAVVQFSYWRLLVFRPPGRPPAAAPVGRCRSANKAPSGWRTCR